jgi:hypothetical protein
VHKIWIVKPDGKISLLILSVEMKVGIVVTDLRKLRKVHDRCTWFDSRNRQEISLFCKVSRPALGLVEAPVQWVS